MVLQEITWETYECLLRNYENQSAPRLTYDRGVLEIMSPLIPHERTNRLLARIIEAILEEWEWDFENLGSFTCRREDIERGFEPDSCFYIQNVSAVRDFDGLDLGQGDPAPDLIIEIDLTSSSIPREPLFAAFGVPEVWRFTEGQLYIRVLASGQYTEATESQALPGLSAFLLNDWLATFSPSRRGAWLNDIRHWAKNNRPEQMAG